MRRQLALFIGMLFAAGTIESQEVSNSIKYVNDHVWTLGSTSDLSSPGPKTVALSACAPGVRGDEPDYFIYVGGAGSGEAVKVNGGSCKGDGKAGTLQFTTAAAHPNGYKLSSASDGLQEALIAARITPGNPPGLAQSGKVVVAPGEYKLRARVSLRASNQTIDFSGSIVECYMDDACLYVGDPANSNAVLDVTLINPRGRPMVPNGTKPFIEVNGQKTRIYNVSTRTGKPGTFGTYVQVDDDQAFLLDGLSTGMGYGVRCDATYLRKLRNGSGAVQQVVGCRVAQEPESLPTVPGQRGRLAIREHTQNFRQCRTRLQPVWRAHRHASRRVRSTALENVYMEAGNCKNKLGNIGAAGIIAMGQRLNWSGGAGPQGKIPVFANTGKQEFRYYLVAHHPKFGYANPLYAGKALTNGTGSITVTTADIPEADRLDLLRITITPNEREQAPYGTGDFAVAKDVARNSACSAGVCTFTDGQAALRFVHRRAGHLFSESSLLARRLFSRIVRGNELRFQRGDVNDRLTVGAGCFRCRRNQACGLR